MVKTTSGIAAASISHADQDRSRAGRFNRYLPGSQNIWSAVTRDDDGCLCLRYVHHVALFRFVVGEMAFEAGYGAAFFGVGGQQRCGGSTIQHEVQFPDQVVNVCNALAVNASP